MFFTGEKQWNIFELGNDNFSIDSQILLATYHITVISFILTLISVCVPA